MFLILSIVLVIIFVTGSAKAVMPPDFIFNLGTQIIQAFSVIFLFFTFIITISYQFLKNWLVIVRGKKWFWLISIGTVLIISLVLAYFYGNFRQNKEYQSWLSQSLSFNKKTTKEIDQLKIGENVKLDSSTEKFIDLIHKNLNDQNTLFIKKYYQYIANGQLEEAYNISKKSVDLETFKSWYTNTTKISLDKLIRIDESRSSLELTLYENNKFTRYCVLITLNIVDVKPVNVEKSEVRVLAEGTTENTKSNNLLENYKFYEQNKNQNIVITNQVFKEALNSSRNDYIVLDARENLEYDNGNLPGSIHIRFADLKAGRWIEVPNDKFVYVLCWSGIRGKEVAEFLRTKKIVAMYLENGADGWVSFGGVWSGNIKFLDKYNKEKYRIVFTTDEVKQKIQEGVKLVDSRQPQKFNDWHVPGSFNIPIMYTPTINMETVFNQVSAKSKVIAICDDYINCFDAKITGAELENRGYEFLGRYNKPWELK